MVVEEKELEEQTNEDVTPDNVNEADSKEAEPEEVELDTPQKRHLHPRLRPRRKSLKRSPF